MGKNLIRKTICLVMLVCLLSLLAGCAGSADTTPGPLQETGDSDITYEASGGGMVDIKGYDAAAITWQPPQELNQRTIPGQLYFANPAFLGSCFQDKQSEGSAQWTDDSKSSITVSFTQNSSQNDGGTVDGPSIAFTVNLDGNSVSGQQSSSYEGESISLSEEEMAQIGAALAGIIQGAEAYCSEN